MDRKEAIRAACVTATLAVAWAGSSSPAQAQTPGVHDTVYIRTNFFHSLSSAQFVAYTFHTLFVPSSPKSMGSINSGISYRTVSLGTGSGSGGNLPFSSYAMVGIGPGSGLNGDFVACSFGDPASAQGLPFETVFPGFVESEVAAAIAGGTDLSAFHTRLGSMPLLTVDSPVVGVALRFSNGALLGTIEASFSPIPEPVSGMVCLGALGFGLISRRRVAV